MKKFLTSLCIFLALCSSGWSASSTWTVVLSGSGASTATYYGLAASITNGVLALSGTFNGASQLVATNSYGNIPLDPHTMSLDGQAFIFVGDSITVGSGLSSGTQAFYSIFSRSPMVLNHGTVTLAATAGWTIENMTTDYATHVKPHRPTANGGDGGPRATIFFLGGINNVISGTETPSSVTTKLTSYVTTARADGFTVCISTILPTWPSGAYYGNATGEANRQGTNYLIRSGSTGADFVVDYARILGDATDATLYPDGVHPSAIGHAIMANYLISGYQNGGWFITGPEGVMEGNRILSGTFYNGTIAPAPGNNSIGVSGTFNMTSGTIAAPSNTGTAAAWVGIKATSGTVTTTYKIPLYQ